MMEADFMNRKAPQGLKLYLELKSGSSRLSSWTFRHDRSLSPRVSPAGCDCRRPHCETDKNGLRSWSRAHPGIRRYQCLRKLHLEQLSARRMQSPWIL